jgi:hypothetical protein
MSFGELAMLVTVKIIAVSFVGAAIGVAIGVVIGSTGGTVQEAMGLSLVLGCVGAPIGAIASATGEIVAALNRRPTSDVQDKLP